MATSVKRSYTSFRGVDFSTDKSKVIVSRSPDALNVWKDYTDDQGGCIQTRPGIKQLANFTDSINGMYILGSKALIHAGTNLILWSNFPDTDVSSTVLKTDMNNDKSTFIEFDDNVYIIDGANYLVYDGTTLKNVTDDSPYIPTTTIGRKPAGGGEEYQDVNLLQPLRKNSFLADGTSTVYYLDAQGIEDVTNVTVDDATVTNYTVNKIAGSITFTTAPSAPTLSNDNVVITFKKTVSGYSDRIAKCTKMVSFDRRLFYAGNPDYPNALFHCALNTPNYVSDLAYYQDGVDSTKIKSISVGNNVLWVFKETSQQNESVFYHEAATYSTGKVYPSAQGNVSTGCYSVSANYKDDIVFLSRSGLEGISSSDINSKQLLNHRSSLVDNKLSNENNFNMAMMAEYQGYLMILVNSKIYLADYRQMFTGTYGYEYEWYLWDFTNVNLNLIKEYNNSLYLGAENGSIFVLEGTNDNGEIINSYWTTPMDNFSTSSVNYGNMYKTTNKRGGVAKIKMIPNGKIKVAEMTNKSTTSKLIKEVGTNGFSYTNFSYANFNYSIAEQTNVVYKIKEKKFVELSLKFYSDELDKPFGLYSAIIEAFIGGYVKR